MIDELQVKGYCVLKSHFSAALIHTCAGRFARVLRDYVKAHHDMPNRGPGRHFLPMPFSCFAPDFFFDPQILHLVRTVMDHRIVADQWGCDVPLQGSADQALHADYQRPLFPEIPDLPLPTYFLVVNFGLIDITAAHGPMEIAPGTHRMPGAAALDAVACGDIALEPVPLAIGDVLIRHPWALHRGTPNRTATARPLVTIRYVRRWYADDSRNVNAIPRDVWDQLTMEQQSMLRFPVAQNTQS